ncbi:MULTISPECIES: MlaD family protein [Olivibacter]|jgi:phospholipid/cholesterol/gamma-HCH transport system substrate-binding protein|uniref:Mammalian cell entry related domain protein n=3 Tax=Sphingobacteriaceae TaxID=84566 RepID=F4CEY4_SPHS2|nr:MULTISPECIES: MlaD family protein [Olivibacter]MCL4639961.1 MlaD family protein [Olivibacter sp. UJ_SKK_5.1]MDM8176314.1 MlaD family protein [Olivibacter sp. 47]MDX3915718.1 MlaD family protein [Pseudosphingobacterium sp.]QEL01072.1 MCE family protein [Olivibacter sp. LS-1]
MKISNETKVGILATVAIAVLIIGYSFLKGNDVFTSENKFYASYDRVDGLSVSKPVMVNGYQIGRVSKMSLQPNGEILTEFKINQDYAIPANTIARIASTDLLGGKAIVFELGDSKDYAQDGDTLRANIQRNILEQVEPVQKKAEAVVAVLDSVLSSINNTINADFQRNFNRSIASIANTLNTLEHTTAQVDAIVGTQRTKLSNILSNVESISANFKNNGERITSILTNMESVTDQVAKANFQQTIQNANAAVADLQHIVDNINNGKGSVGLLLNDEELYNNLNNASKNLDCLMIDLREHPSRYVHFSVFGKKDKDGKEESKKK